MGLLLSALGLLSTPMHVAQGQDSGSEQRPQCLNASWNALKQSDGHPAPLNTLKELLGPARVTASTSRVSEQASRNAYGLVLGTSHGRVLTWTQTGTLCQWQLPSSGGNGPSPVQALLPLQDGTILVAAGLELYRVPLSQDEPIQPIHLGAAAQAEGAMLDAVPPAYFTAMLQRSNGQVLLGSAGGVWSMPAPGPQGGDGPELCVDIPANRVRALVQPTERHIVVGSRTQGLVWLELTDQTDCSSLKPLISSEKPLRKDVTALAVLASAGEEPPQVAYGTFDGEVGIASPPSEPLRLLRPPRQSASPAIVHRIVPESSGRLLVAIGQELYALGMQDDASTPAAPLIPQGKGHDPRQVGTFLLLSSGALLIGAERVSLALPLGVSVWLWVGLLAGTLAAGAWFVRSRTARS